MSFSDALKELLRVDVAISFLVGGTFGLITYVISPTARIPAWIIIVVLFFGTSAIFIQAAFISKLKEKLSYLEGSDLSPKLIKFIQDDKEVIALVKYTNLLSLNSFVTIYLKQSEYEKYIANGFVYHIQDQDNKIIQIKILNFSDNSTEDMQQNIINNNTELIKSISIKPTISYKDIEDHIYLSRSEKEAF